MQLESPSPQVFSFSTPLRAPHPWFSKQNYVCGLTVTLQLVLANKMGPEMARATLDGRFKTHE